MNNTDISTALAMRNGLIARRERERRTLIDMGYSPELAAVIMETEPVRHAILSRRKYLAKRAMLGAHRRGLKGGKNLKPDEVVLNAASPGSSSRPTFDDIFGEAA